MAQEECDTPVGDAPIIFDKTTQDSVNAVMAINTPYCVRAYVTVFADNNGSNRAAADVDIVRQFENMVNQFSNQNICFMLMNIEQVNNSDLNSHNRSTEESELNPFIVDNCLNIFIHNVLQRTNNDGTIGNLNGTAYAIPNSYLSLVGGTVTSTFNLTTLAHETGHCLGLYHTFETWGGTKAENVTRNSSSTCYDCLVDGDVLCDTPADDNGGQSAACNYTGGGTDGCGATLNPATNNIMGYGSRNCRTLFTNGQGSRMRTFLTTNGTVSPLVAHDDLYRPSGSNASIFWTSGTRTQTARDELFISNNANNVYSVTSSAEMYMQAKRVRLGPGTRFAPTSGKVHVKPNTYCD